MLKLDHIKHVYRAGDIETYALNELTLKIERGEFVAITGPSGAGKTTLLNVLGLLETLDGGRYELDGIDTQALSDRARSELRNRKIGFVFQNFNLLPDLTIGENVALPLRYRRVKNKECTIKAAAALERVGLSGRIHHFPSQLSGGQQQRAAIARALIGEPALILADEPTGNLDSKMTEGVLNLLQEVHQNGATIVMVTHDENIASQADRVVSVVDGRADVNAPNV